MVIFIDLATVFYHDFYVEDNKKFSDMKNKVKKKKTVSFYLE